MADDIEPPRELGEDDLAPEPPEYLQGHSSIWNTASAAEIGSRGATPQERDIFAEQMYKAYVDRNASPDERRAARRDLEAPGGAFDFWGVNFDYRAWRKEMGY